LTKALRAPIVQSRDLFFTLTRPAIVEPRAEARLLTPNEAEFYAEFADDFHDAPDCLDRNAREGPIAVAIIDGRVVSAVEANVRTKRHANLTADTLAAFRNRGLCIAAASVAAQAVQAMSLRPVWSCHETNAASQRVARKVGFTEVSHWVFLAPQRDDARV
jgi:RimJ/RimL family protein N-acetyltransferase